MNAATGENAGLESDQAAAARLIARFQVSRPKHDCTHIFRVSAIRNDGLMGLQFLASSFKDAEEIKEGWLKTPLIRDVLIEPEEE